MEIKRTDLYNIQPILRDIPAPPVIKREEAAQLPGESVILSGKISNITETKDCCLEKAEKIALNVVKINTHKVGVPGVAGKRKVFTAGSDHFNTFWTRDACYGGMGVVDRKDGQKVIKDQLQTLFDRSNPSGELPRRQGDYGNPFLLILSALGMKPPCPKNLTNVEYKNELGAHQFDSTALPIMLSLEYYKNTGDIKFLEKNYKALDKSIAWLEKMDTNVDLKLIDQPGSGDWKDIVRRKGMVGYTNAILHGAFKAAAEINRTMGNWDKAEHNEKYADKIKKEFNAVLWDEKRGFYRDSNYLSNFSPDGNMFAIIYGIADKRQTELVLNKLEDFMNKSNLPLPATEGEYPDDMISRWTKLLGIRHYHDRFIWPWQGNVLAIAAARGGRPDLAEKALRKVAEQTVKDKTFYEIYDHEGDLKPVRTIAYKSEPDFMWGAGTYLWALREVKAAKKGKTNPVEQMPEIRKPAHEEHKGFIIS